MILRPPYWDLISSVEISRPSTNNCKGGFTKYKRSWRFPYPQLTFLYTFRTRVGSARELFVRFADIAQSTRESLSYKLPERHLSHMSNLWIWHELSCYVNEISTFLWSLQTSWAMRKVEKRTREVFGTIYVDKLETYKNFVQISWMISKQLRNSFQRGWIKSNAFQMV